MVDNIKKKPIPDPFFHSVLSAVSSEPDMDKAALQIAKKDASKGLSLDRIPSDADIFQWLLDNDMLDEYSWLLPNLKIKRTRTISGVAPVAVMTSPHECPHGKCITCPGGPENETPQSYTGHEPAALRAAQWGYDPFKQVTERLRQLKVTGHSTEKVDLIIMGGTFTAREPEYQVGFIKGCLDALNGSSSTSLKEAQLNNETADHRCIGLTIETRPDWFKQEHIDRSLDLGATRVELGVQSVFDDVLEKMERGHDVQTTIDSTKMAKDSGLKIVYHMMPGLLGSNKERDLEGFRRIFEEPEFKPDMLKIYPTLVVKGTKLYDLWKAGEYEPLDSRQAAKLVADIKELIPPWIRVQRIQRDIPAKLIEAGVDKSNLRQLARNKLKERGTKCRCIRCREAGHALDDEEARDLGTELVVREYDASGGHELFLSLENKEHDVLTGFLRLRIPSEEANRPEIAGKEIAMIRELKVFGAALGIGMKDEEKLQHRGSGKVLLEKAEEMAQSLGRKRILVNSGIGVRDYYRALGYQTDGVYLGKPLF